MIKKVIVMIFTILFGKTVFCQNPTVKGDIPSVAPPSPSVEALMKFQEIAVNNYTGIPDISIPILDVPTHSKDVNVNIVLRYHPANVKADNVAGDVGLGWSLQAAGTISRNVRGLPDEELTFAGAGNTGRVGLYHTDVPNHSNIYYSWMQNPSNYEQSNTNITNEYYWETIENGKYDTEHDFWQFNFMGNSGRFLMRRIGSEIVIEPLSDYRVKIINHYDTINNQPFTPIGFTIYDEKGYKYKFDIYEETTKYVDSQYFTIIKSNHITSESHADDKPFRSSFHLSSVSDANDQTIFEITYNPSYTEINRQYNIINNDYGDDSSILFNAMKYANCWGEIPPMKSKIVSGYFVSVNKLQTIKIPGSSNIQFNYEVGRDDFSTISSTPYLKTIQLRTINDSIVSTFTLDYDYNEILVKRLFLRGLTKSYPNQIKTESYDFFYKRNIPLGNPLIFGRDYWGYFNTYNLDNCTGQDINFMRDASPIASTFDLLQKINYPTKGSTIFHFETNQYSFIGDQLINDFSENPYNSPLIGSNTYYFSNATAQLIPISNEKRKIITYPSIVHSNDHTTWTRTIRLIKIINGQSINVEAIHCVLPNNNCCREFILEPNIQYAFKRDNFDLNYSGIDNMIVNFYSLNNTHEFLLGGGNRIKAIGYFDSSAPQDYYDALYINITPSKEKVFSYNLFSDPTKSSGSLVFGKTKFEEQRFLSQLGTNCSLPPFLDFGVFQGSYSYSSKFIISNQEKVFTNGADVGYKNIEIKETGNGSTEETYTSSIDYPEIELITYTKPYLPSKNIDYKRGLLLKRVLRDELDRVLIEDVNTYSFENFEKIYGYRLNKPDGAIFQGRFKKNGVPINIHNYSTYISAINSPEPTIKDCIDFLCDSFSKQHLGTSPINEIDFYPLSLAYGWAKLSSKNTKNYFYEGGNQEIVVTNERFTYNTTNKKIAKHTIDYIDGNTIEKKYFYDIGNDSPFSQNRISEIKKIESYKNNQLIESKEIIYGNAWENNVSFLPKYVKSYNIENAAFSVEFTYDKYDTKGNLLQYTTNGITTVIIWGYNSTQPIAKIEGKIPGMESFLPPIIAASDTDHQLGTPTSEEDLRVALDTFRKAVYAETRGNVQITTYTYDPLVGVRSITPPSGIREVYLYDAASRLERIVDVNGKILKEYRYNYKH